MGSYSQSVDCILFSKKKKKRIIWQHQYSLFHLFLFCVSKLSDQTPKNARFIYAIILVIINSALRENQLGYCHASDIFNGETISYICKTVAKKSIGDA